MSLPVAQLGFTSGGSGSGYIPAAAPRPQKAWQIALQSFLANGAGTVAGQVAQNALSKDYSGSSQSYLDKLLEGPVENRQQLEASKEREAIAGRQEALLGAQKAEYTTKLAQQQDEFAKQLGLSKEELDKKYLDAKVGRDIQQTQADRDWFATRNNADVQNRLAGYTGQNVTSEVAQRDALTPGMVANQGAQNKLSIAQAQAVLASIPKETAEAALTNASIPARAAQGQIIQQAINGGAQPQPQPQVAPQTVNPTIQDLVSPQGTVAPAVDTTPTTTMSPGQILQARQAQNQPKSPADQKAEDFLRSWLAGAQGSGAMPF